MSYAIAVNPKEARNGSEVWSQRICVPIISLFLSFSEQSNLEEAGIKFSNSGENQKHVPGCKYWKILVLPENDGPYCRCVGLDRYIRLITLFRYVCIFPFW